MVTMLLIALLIACIVGLLAFIGLITQELRLWRIAKRFRQHQEAGCAIDLSELWEGR